MKFKYLYQDKNNQNLEGEIEARDRAEAYTKLRKNGIRPYRVIGNDPWNWRPWAYFLALFLSVSLSIFMWLRFVVFSDGISRTKYAISEEEGFEFRRLCQERVDRAPAAFRYDVWKGVNLRLEERGLDPIPLPEGLTEDGLPTNLK